jgi:hypothetical protein
MLGVMALERLIGVLREISLMVKGFHQAMLEESVGALEAEYVELENAFLTMLFGPLIGIKTAPALLTLELLESVKGEISILESRGYRGEDVLGDLMALGGEW